MSANRKFLWTVLMLLMVTLTMSPMVSAKSGDKVKLKRDSRDLNPASQETSFGEASPTADMCSGSCSCSFCSCYGTSACCDAGCDACWEFRDDQGLCGAVQ